MNCRKCLHGGRKSKKLRKHKRRTKRRHRGGGEIISNCPGVPNAFVNSCGISRGGSGNNSRSVSDLGSDMGSDWCKPTPTIFQALGMTACGTARGGRRTYKGGNQIVKSCSPPPNAFVNSCGLAKAGGRRRRTRGGGEIISKCPGVPNAFVNSCGLAKAGGSRRRRTYKGGKFGHKKHYNKCGPLPWPMHSKCKSPQKCSRKIGHPAGIGHGRGSHTCY